MRLSVRCQSPSSICRIQRRLEPALRVHGQPLHGAVPILKPIDQLQARYRVLTEPSRELGYAFPIALVANAEPVMRASYVNDSNYLRERAAEMRSSSKELKDNNTAAVIMRLADLYDRLADRAETRGDRAVRSDRAQPKMRHFEL